ncbi:MAG: haloacid dehalogenase-like hydrolase [Clostridia bacterium]|nr:haloacid dehalogenase-like hydrolase [Clostridia bacterium]MBR3553100.1 haloacid dehalogenase-like hydrolase [Clostridia bacterium]
MNVYDFDETIYDGESSIEFILDYIRVDPKVIKFVPSIIRIMFLYERGKITFDDFSEKYAHKLTDYFAANNVTVEHLMQGFWDKRMHKIKPFYLAQKKADDVILTASPTFMMREVCDRLGVKNLVATDFDLETGKVKNACFRENKIRCFFDAFPDGEIDAFYTDSVNDSFLFPLAKEAYMVKKNKIIRVK